MGREMTSRALAGRVEKSLSGDAPQGVLLDLDVEVSPGITIWFGPSGAGKWTLLDCIAGLTQPDAGRIAIDGEALFDSDKNVNVAPQSRRVAYVFQTLALFPHMTVESNIAYGLPDGPGAAKNARVAEILRRLR